MIVENPIRREIIRSLSQEPSYPLQLSGSLGIHQPLITKHLKVMEEAEVVEAKTESSPYGPNRKMYHLNKSMSLMIDFSPDLYSVRMSSFEDVSLPSKYKASGEFRDRLDDISKKDRHLEGINPYVDLIADIDRRVVELEGERTVLLYLRSLAMRAAKEDIKGRNISLRERMVTYHILNDNERTVRNISGSLDMREEVVKRIIDRLREDSILR
ncbi:MAG: ArsR/SmtB family transcription factor [Nitrososphaerales archaeon]